MVSASLFRFLWEKAWVESNLLMNSKLFEEESDIRQGYWKKKQNPFQPGEPSEAAQFLIWETQAMTTKIGFQQDISGNSLVKVVDRNAGVNIDVIMATEF